MGVRIGPAAPRIRGRPRRGWSMQALLEILVILLFLACAALAAAGALDAARWLRGRPGLGRAHWSTLLGGTALVFLLLVLLILAGGLAAPVGR